MPSWTDHAIWWQVYPLGFTGAPATAQPEVRHRLRHLEAWLDYAVELGCSGLQLGPIFASETHGYDTVDHFRIDPRLGDDADFDSLVAEARRRGLRIVLDGVFNHVGRSFQADERWFRRGSEGYEVFEGHHGLVALDHTEPAVRHHVAAVLNHWLDRGAAGWRLDAAYAVPASFWREVLPEVRARHPEAWFGGEVIHGDYAKYVAESGLDSVTQYELWKAIWSSLNDRNLFELAWALDRHDGLLDTFVPLTFVGNHDVTRIATRLENPQHLGHALAVLFTVGGLPSVYYGDEQAFQGLKEERAGGDDAIRPAFPAEPGGLAPDGTEVYRLHQRLIGLRRRHPWLVRAHTTAEHLTNTAVALRSRPRDGGGTEIVTLLNLGDEPHRFPIGQVNDVAEPQHGVTDPAVVPAHGWSIVIQVTEEIGNSGKSGSR
ncbi:alpha-amylase family glycosyl hydrolase [Nonomuraea sp. NEAU-A123]|uniref:alpha-amylase family glycosyl hydrolase n=1 Tax=Nonomuraea sp. NEAU-A123 TaxID=2839649 RepID=UPI001BE4AC19|nr:alpha-amylase family glycosyl hydrolase [Nonomuraea sp. NEAU-A123]MBT2233042.1 alpha-amylase family protein [Nonomuraea sp. NEAU-A123]